ncbi:MAG: helix-turn-helix domain-containing protein [Planctomycetota bacterium]
MASLQKAPGTPQARPMDASPTATLESSSQQSPTTADMENEYFSPEDIATLLTVSIHTVRAWRKTGFLPLAFKVGRFVRWSKKDIHEWIRMQRELQEARSPSAVELVQSPLAFRR